MNLARGRGKYSDLQQGNFKIRIILLLNKPLSFTFAKKSVLNSN